MNRIHPTTCIQSFEAQKASRTKIPNGIHVMDLLTAMHPSPQGVSPRLAEWNCIYIPLAHRLTHSRLQSHVSFNDILLELRCAQGHKLCDFGNTKSTAWHEDDMSSMHSSISSARIGEHGNSKICNAVTCRRTYQPVHSGKNSSPGSLEHPSRFRRKPCSPPSVLQAI
ncbi:hypothetical protein COCSADRAFT_30160 [Bipolaris sorokiniana ND90Pr]|uniref:Uncharacterized protein n=1 Tax=Cochliobolus sativus (strain ND90Pr / ATCC 201652) TaxID=665912 RepID=M2QYP2_COCSN|nr:uncharacterized protein COCSADRAFT_30160 [Bipolaris sorokiniana ND90Pr]EMD60129.1 hypothetical protein COCSADRAFT_30160 [Bipolaris sorokiniana ND90Pr]